MKAVYPLQKCYFSSSCGRLRAQFFSTFFQKVANKEKCNISAFVFNCIEQQGS